MSPPLLPYVHPARLGLPLGSGRGAGASPLPPWCHVPVHDIAPGATPGHRGSVGVPAPTPVRVPRPRVPVPTTLPPVPAILGLHGRLPKPGQRHSKWGSERTHTDARADGHTHIHTYIHAIVRAKKESPHPLHHTKAERMPRQHSTIRMAPAGGISQRTCHDSNPGPRRGHGRTAGRACWITHWHNKAEYRSCAGRKGCWRDPWGGG